ncbi:hypothetical protein HD806DRAFT_551869 [Xylariaceae sp. AK1471]|nr:hypothetical protein HD806DRAFT_551869 [Xylariaceae sp. AK1471]
MPFPPVVLADLGTLSRLPLELVLMVLGYLDVPNAATFTLVNRQAQFLLWSDKDYLLIRECLFWDLSRGVNDPKSRFKLTRCTLLKDVNYHTLAAMMLNPVCLKCGNAEKERLYYLEVCMGYYSCGTCYRRYSYLGTFIVVTTVESSHEQLNRTIPFRLPKGQLVLLRPDHFERLIDRYQNLQERGREDSWSNIADVIGMHTEHMLKS